MTLFATVAATSLVRNIKPFFPLLVYAAVAGLLATLYFSSFNQIETLIQEEKLNYLGSTAEAKAGQIAAWRDTQQRIVESVAHDSLLAAEFGQWLRAGAPSNGHRQALLRRLDELRQVNGYSSLVLLDRQGRVRLSLPAGSALAAEDARLARQAMDSRQPLFSDFHRNSNGDQGISIDLVAPIIGADGGAGRVVGAAVLQIDPSRFLYPLIRAWPLPSVSGETLLVRQEGDDVLFLNDLRHRSGTALSLRLPLSTPRLPAALAVKGEARITDGIDYRGVGVVAEMRGVPGTPWFVVSKVDHEELYGPLAQLESWSAGIAMIYVAIGGLLVLAWLYGQKAQDRYLRAQHAAAQERAMLVKHFEYLTRYANDIIVVADESGRIVEANERAERAYGYSRLELLGMRVTDLRDTNEDPAVFAAQVRQLQAAGELRYETVSRRKDGSTFPVEVSARLITVEGVRYMQGISRDTSERKRAEEALRKSETLLKASQQMAHIGSWEMDLKSNILFWSDENYRIFEIDPTRFGASYEAFLEAVHPDDRERVNDAYTDSVQNRTPYTIVHRLQFPDRPVKYVQEWCETFYDEHGQPLRSVGTTQDVTVQQLAQNALRESAQQIEDLYNHAPCGYHSLDTGGVIVRINDTELQWLGYARDEVIGKMNFADLLTPDSLRNFRDNYPGFKARGFVHDLEYELVRRDGTSFPVLLNATAVLDPAGNYLMSRATLFDITARKLAERRLAESEERFRTMADHAPIMIWMADAQDKPAYRGCDFFNQRWHDFTGLTLEQTHGRRWLDIVHPDDRNRCLAAYQRVFRRKRPFRMEYRVRRRDGMFRWIQDAGVPRFAGEGKLIGYIGTWLDVTDHKLFEELRAEMEHVGRLNIAGEMASGLAHELSQPLSAAGNYLSAVLRQMTEREWDRERLQHTIGLARAQTARAGEIIGHLKAMVRKQRQERSMLDINTLVQDTVNLLEFELQQGSIALEMDLSPLPLTLASKIEIEQVLINLVKNAIDAMADARPRELRLATRIIESGFILVSVRDSGKGIAADQLDKVFDPFQTSKKEGLGLGLPICRSLIENHGGQIWAEQNAGAGVEFNFTLPIGVSNA
jgi:PAS domain S-box-containing protein